MVNRNYTFDKRIKIIGEKIEDNIKKKKKLTFVCFSSFFRK